MKRFSTGAIPPLHGLVLAGGRSRRMGRDKASLRYGNASAAPQWLRTAHLLADLGLPTQIATRPGQTLSGTNSAAFPCLPDAAGIEGPLAGLFTAMRTTPEAAWLVLACDLPLLDAATLQQLITVRQPDKLATVFRNPLDHLPDPLCAIYEPAFLLILIRETENGNNPGPRKLLIDHQVQIHTVVPDKPDALKNANTPEDYNRLTPKT